MITVFALTGILLIFLEFFLPGAVMAIGGTLMLLASLAMFYFEASEVWHVVVYAISLCVVIGLIIFLALRRIRKGRILHTSDQQGFVASAYPKEMIGKMGVVTADLKPAGYIEIDGSVFSALSKLEYIEKGNKVRVIDGQGAYLIVYRNQEKKNHV